MKKSILIVISLVAVFFFAGTTQVSAQWTSTVYWIDNNCNCNIITSKVLEWEIRKISDNSLIASGEQDITSSSSPVILDEDDEIETDTFYKICVKISYYDGSAIDPLCCSDSDCQNTDGQGLIDGDVIFYLVVQ